MKSASVSAPGNAPASVATRSVGPESLWSLLRVLFTARTVYEVGYEQAHRPGWLAIPLDDLLEIVRRD